MTNVMYQDLTVKNTLDATSIGAGLIAAIRDALLPVGSVVCCTTSPAGRIGGTWAQIEDVFILAAGSTYAEDSTGGEATHVLTLTEMATHDHQVYHSVTAAYGNDVSTISNSVNGELTWDVLQSVGDNTPHNNMPPYVAKKYWERTA